MFVGDRYVCMGIVFLSPWVLCKYMYAFLRLNIFMYDICMYILFINYHTWDTFILSIRYITFYIDLTFMSRDYKICWSLVNILVTLRRLAEALFKFSIHRTRTSFMYWEMFCNQLPIRLQSLEKPYHCCLNSYAFYGRKSCDYLMVII